MKNKKSFNVRKMAIIGVLGAISAVLGMTPLGFIPVGPTRATIMHIPVIIVAIMEGPVVGALVGLIFGLFSIFNAISNPTAVSVVFLNPMVSVVPRILIGLVTYYVYSALKKQGNKILNGNLEEITVFLETLNNNGKNYGKFLEDVMLFLKDLILYKKNVSSKLIKTDDIYMKDLVDLYSF